MTMSEVFFSLLSRLEQGDLLTRMKNKTRRLLVEIWGKVNWDKRWQGSIFNELANKCAKRTTSFNHRKHYVDSLLLRFQRMLLLAWKELKYVSISYILLFFEDVPQLFFVANIKSWELEIAFSNHKAALKIMKKLQGQSFTIVVLMDFLKKCWQWLWFRRQFLSDMAYMFS